MNPGAFLTKGLDYIRAEFSLTTLVYNLRRARRRGDDGGRPGVTGGALARPTHLDNDRGITEGFLRQNARTSLKVASAIGHRSDGAVSTRSASLSKGFFCRNPNDDRILDAVQ